MLQRYVNNIPEAKRCGVFDILSVADCRNSGQFNSLTRRGRRSLVDQTPVEENPRFQSSLARDADLRNNSITEELALPPEPEAVTSAVQDNNTVVPEVRTRLDVETQDERIEGLEAVMAKLQRTLKVKTVS
jgi:hypothetical protein